MRNVRATCLDDSSFASRDALGVSINRLADGLRQVGYHWTRESRSGSSVGQIHLAHLSQEYDVYAKHWGGDVHVGGFCDGHMIILGPRVGV